VDGPFSEAKELVGGFWIIEVKSKEEAVSWASRIPFDSGVVELRQIAELSDFPEDLQKAAGNEQGIRDRLEQQTSAR
jgi:hypothetical protein